MRVIVFCIVVWALAMYIRYSPKSDTATSFDPPRLTKNDRREIADLAYKREVQGVLDKLAELEQERQRKLEAARDKLDATTKHWEAQLIEDYRACVEHGMMTPEQFQHITGQPYRLMHKLNPEYKPPTPVETKNPFARKPATGVSGGRFYWRGHETKKPSQPIGLRGLFFCL